MRLVEYVLYIIFANSIAENDEHFVVADDATGKQYGMADALAFVLVNEMSRQLGIFLPDEVLDLLAEIAYDEDELGNAGFHQLVDDDGEDGLAS